MPGRSKRGVMVKSLGQLEAVVMQRLWDASEALPVRAVLEDLQREREIAYTTVMTVLDNLHSKGVVRRHKEGRAFVYEATQTRAAYTAGLLDDVLDSTGDKSAVLLHFLGRLDKDTRAKLRGALDRDDGSSA